MKYHPLLDIYVSVYHYNTKHDYDKNLIYEYYLKE